MAQTVSPAQSQTVSPLWESIEALPLPAAGSQRYLLVNQAALPGQRALLARLSVFERRALFAQEIDACTDGVTPFIARIDNAPQHAGGVLRDLADAACYACALSVIDTPLNARDAAAALSARGEVELPDGVAMLLRHFDTRVFMSVTDVLSDEQRAAFLSLATEWWYADREGAMVPSARLGQEGIDAFVPPLRLSPEQERAMLESAEPDAVIDLLLSRGTAPLADMPYPSRYPAVYSLVKRARAWGLEDIPDLAAFCTLALYGPDDFDRLPPWNALLPQVAQGAMTFTAALERVQDMEEDQ